MKIKTMLTTAVVAIFAGIGLGATHTVHATEVSGAYNEDLLTGKAVEGTLTTIKCTFHTFTNDFEWSCVGGGKADTDLDFGTYEIFLSNINLKKGVKYEFVSQKLSGEHSPNFLVKAKENFLLWSEWYRSRASDLKDTKIHVDTISPSTSWTGKDGIYIEGDFGYHTSGSEEITGYLRLK